MRVVLATLRVLTVAIALCLAVAPIAAPAQVTIGVFVDTPPPPIPTYVQPEAPFVNAMWTPGYWAWGSGGYYWVPGTWVHPYATGLLWTPGYWGYEGTGYRYWPGYWGPTVGYYGGINYGFGYWGSGFYGGVWHGGAFSYNTAVWNVNRTVIHNTYVDRTVVNRYSNNVHTSYNGGRGGINVHPTPDQVQDRKLAHERMTPDQRAHEQAASHDSRQYASHNHGAPPHMTSAKPMTAPDHDAHEPTDADRHAAQAHVQHPPADHPKGGDAHHPPV